MFYDGDAARDFPIDVQMILNQRFDIDRTTKNILKYKYKINFNDKCNEKKINIHRFFRNLSVMYNYDINVYDSEPEGCAAFVYSNYLVGINKKYPEKDTNLVCLTKNTDVASKAYKKMDDEFREEELIFKSTGNIKEITDILSNRTSSKRPYIYLPYMYLYMLGIDVKETLLNEGHISEEEASYWDEFYKFFHHDRIGEARFIMTTKCNDDARVKGIGKMRSGFVNIADFGSITDGLKSTICHNINHDDIYLIDYNNVNNPNDLPNEIIYSDSKYSFIIRTNIPKDHNI